MKRITTSLAVLLALGCGPSGGTDTGIIDIPDAPMTDGGMPAVDAPRDTPAVTGDGNDTFATAEEAMLGVATGGAIATPGDLDYFQFTGEAGQWIQIVTEANPDDNPEMIDTVVTLYDSAMNQIAENDDSPPRVNTDSEITTRLPTAGTYYVLVQEFSTWMPPAPPAPEGEPSYEYELTVAALNLEAEVVNVDEELGDTAAEAQALSLVTTTAPNLFGIVVGELNDATDVDVYSFSVLTADPVNFSVDIMPSGADGFGSTAVPAHIWVTDADAADAIIARIDPNDLDSVDPSLPMGNYNLWIEHGGAAGSNDFYVLKVFQLGENPLEMMETENDVAATPEALTFAANMTGGVSGFILADLPDGDTDYYGIEIAADATISAVCGSRSSGSGVEGLTIALLEDDGTTVLGMDTETATEGALIGGGTMALPIEAGSYLLRITQTGQDPEVTGTFVRCGVHVNPPTP